MVTEVKNYLEAQVAWKNETDPEYPYAADFEGERWVIHLNNFPDENLYTLIVDDVEVAHFDDWPELWSRPASHDLSDPASSNTLAVDRP